MQKAEYHAPQGAYLLFQRIHLSCVVNDRCGLYLGLCLARLRHRQLRLQRIYHIRKNLVFLLTPRVWWWVHWVRKREREKREIQNTSSRVGLIKIEWA